MTVAQSEHELCMMLHAKLRETNVCAGVVVTRVHADDDSWEFEIPAGVSAPCRNAIIRAQIEFKMQFHLHQID